MEKKSVLEVIVDDVPWVDKKFCADYDSIPKDERGHGWWYLHGELQYIVGYDIAYATNCKSAGYSRETINWETIKGDKVVRVFDDAEKTRQEMYVNGIIPVKVKGIDKPCVGYFWTTDEHLVRYEEKEYPYWKQRGLVCLESDSEGREYALSKMRTGTDRF